MSPRSLPTVAVGALLALAVACVDDQPKAPAPPPTPARDAGTGPAGVDPLDPLSIPKFQEPLVIPPEMPPEAITPEGPRYRIGARLFTQQVLPRGFPETTVFGYGAVNDVRTFHYPGFTVEARSGQQITVDWVNQLKTFDGRFLPHLLPIDPTLHWADPMGLGHEAMDYDGPVPLVAHVHGAHVPWTSDGHPEAWFLPAATDLPEGIRKKGVHFNTAGKEVEGEARFVYPNDQRAMTLWYHDHALGITRLNVYAGLAGFWLLRDDEEDALGLPGPAPRLGDAPGTRYYEIPIAIQDRSFFTDGSWSYPGSREEFGDYSGPFHPDTDVAPVWNPEVFGNVMLANGRTWPYLEVEPRLYRLRLLNGCNARTVILALDAAGATFTQIGNEGGLLPGGPITAASLTLMPAERADVLVDFSKFKPGTTIVLKNLGPDEPFAGLRPEEPQAPADPRTTGQVMQFRVVALTDEGTPGRVPTTLPEIAPLATDLPPRALTLHEMAKMPEDVPTHAMLGTPDRGALRWMDEATEKPIAGTTEIWEIANLTVDAHPIHLHLVHFQVLDRTPIDAEGFLAAQEEHVGPHGGHGSGEEEPEEGTAPRFADYLSGAPLPPEPSEAGWKETVIANPGEVTRVIATFDLAGKYVWHCHILEHEDNDMMRPLEVQPAP